ncbi:MAG: hypothetical protein IK955_03985 [Clostridia bacterium]|nr:hypothetical protein [Clostridia bacterium]
MNDKGKFKKTTIIIMLVAVFISICSLAWVLIFQGDDAYQETNKDFYNETAAIYTKTTKTDDPADSGDTSDVKVKVPVDFILERINTDSQLTQEQKDLGFKSAIYDGQSSVTYTMSKEKYRQFLLSYRFDITTDIEDALWRMYPSFKELDFNDDLTHFTVRVNRAEFNSAESADIAGLIADQAEFYQAFAMLNANCTVAFSDYETNATITTVTP